MAARKRRQAAALQREELNAEKAENTEDAENFGATMASA